MTMTQETNEMIAKGEQRLKKGFRILYYFLDIAPFARSASDLDNIARCRNFINLELKLLRENRENIRKLKIEAN